MNARSITVGFGIFKRAVNITIDGWTGTTSVTVFKDKVS